MTTPRFEAFLAMLYVDADVRRRFVADARATAAAAGLDAGEIEALAHIDLTGLELAARSYAAKRASNKPRVRERLSDWLLHIFRRRTNRHRVLRTKDPFD